MEPVIRELSESGGTRDGPGICPDCGGTLDLQRPCAGNPWFAVVGASPSIFLPVLFFGVLGAPLLFLFGSLVLMALALTPVAICFARASGPRFAEQGVRVCHPCGTLQVGEKAWPEDAGWRGRAIERLTWLTQRRG